FSFVPRVEGEPVANRAEGGKRPRSSMTPTLVFDPEGRFRLAIGSPGGSRIIDYTTKVVVGVLDWELDVQAAIDLPNIINRNRGTTELETDSPAVRLREGLEAMGHDVAIRTLTSGLHGITAIYAPDGRFVRYEGGADRRREGRALGR
ncbi:MAG: gamma-glutamyltransferase, partial [Pseudomonadota bacterium]